MENPPSIIRWHTTLFRHSPFTKILALATIITPYAQIISSVYLLFLSFINIFFIDISFDVVLFPLAFQLFFAFALLAVGGLGFIPYLYSFAVIVFTFYSFNYTMSYPQEFDFGPVIFTSIFYISAYILGCFRLLEKITPKLSFYLRPLVPAGPHYMFTEYNLDGMITFSCIRSDPVNNLLILLINMVLGHKRKIYILISSFVSFIF